ncbi:WD40/YVTN/BNR-like repeat-containing protein, partial [Salmonella enterica]|uniref:WD40/YVTN/BNR-like repeat-containing protein n=1 Tax=Salmonella enterica TaxID=28901 RepID=UPI00329993D0
MQDTMGFAVVGPDRFIGSGHPELRDDLPPLLGLISSSDAGRTWEPVSLLGEADFHALDADGARVVGYDASGGRLMRSDDGGRTWTTL